MPTRKLLRRDIVEESDDEEITKPTLAEQLNQEANHKPVSENKSGTNSNADPNS